MASPRSCAGLVDYSHIACDAQLSIGSAFPSSSALVSFQAFGVPLFKGAVGFPRSKDKSSQEGCLGKFRSGPKGLQRVRVHSKAYTKSEKLLVFFWGSHFCQTHSTELCCRGQEMCQEARNGSGLRAAHPDKWHGGSVLAATTAFYHQ